MTIPRWRQTTISFAAPHAAEQVAIDHLAPIMAKAEILSLISAWFYVRKGEWRLRYLPTAHNAAAQRHVTGELERLTHDRLIQSATAGVYEPEVHAFGGTKSMDIAHRLWHQDSRHLVSAGASHSSRQREISTVLCATMMRAAGLDWYEQGDVWVRVSDHRDLPDPARVVSLHEPVRRLLTVDPASLTVPDAPLSDCRTVVDAYTSAGAALGQLNQTGQLHRGLRAVLAHHVIFAWNRRGIPGLHQAAVATAAKTIIFGPDPTIDALT